MNWFKSLWLTSEERKILKEAKEKNEKIKTFQTYPKVEPVIEGTKPYSKLLYNRGIVTVIFRGGEVISQLAPTETYQKVKECKTEIEIEELLLGKKPVEVAIKIEDKTIKEAITDTLEMFHNHEDFVVNADLVFLKNTIMALPQPIVCSFIEILERWEVAVDPTEIEELQNNYNALKMFSLWLSLCPIEKSRKDLMTFVRRNDVKITNNGNMVLYRRIVSVGEKSKELVEFVSLKYYDRKKQKKSETHPRNYLVVKQYDDGDDAYEGTCGYDIIKHTEVEEGITVLGNLEDMFKNLDKVEENNYTSQHNKGMLKIKIGGIYKIPDSEINLDNGLCAAGGLHAAAVDYDYSGFGDVPVVVLVNPSKAITVPTYDQGKLRTTEMFIACINDKEHGQHFDDNDLTAFDEEYHNTSVEELEKAVASKNLGTLAIKDEQVVVTLNNLSTIKDMLKNRVTEVV